jgi:hypothetical protein
MNGNQYDRILFAVVTDEGQCLDWSSIELSRSRAITAFLKRLDREQCQNLYHAHMSRDLKWRLCRKAGWRTAKIRVMVIE